MNYQRKPPPEVVEAFRQRDVDAFDCDYYAWPQTFGSTSGPRGGIAGQATSSFTVEAYVVYAVPKEYQKPIDTITMTEALMRSEGMYPPVECYTLFVCNGMCHFVKGEFKIGVHPMSSKTAQKTWKPLPEVKK